MNVKRRSSTIQKGSKHRFGQFSFAMFALFLAAALPTVAQQVPIALSNLPLLPPHAPSMM
jgi:hypothetical protein